MPVNHSAGSKIAVAHTVQVAQGSLLADMLGPGEAPEVDGFLRLPVNTSHHQAVAIPGAGLRVTARSPEDGVIEAVELDVGAPVFHVEHFHGQKLFLGVQWHPERSFEISAASRAMFARLIAEAREVREWRRDNVAEGAVS
jgi:putative glutamine amidotransferase